MYICDTIKTVLYTQAHNDTIVKVREDKVIYIPSKKETFPY